MDKFKINDRVSWKVSDTIFGTGIVLGKGMDIGLHVLGLVELYIIGLDKPVPGMDVRAILVPTAALSLIKDDKCQSQDSKPSPK